MHFFEGIVILLIIGYQVYIYLKNTRQILKIKNLFPYPEQLSIFEKNMDEEEVNSGKSNGVKIKWQALLHGELFKLVSSQGQIVRKVVDIENEIARIEARGVTINNYTMPISELYNLLFANEVLFVNENLNSTEESTNQESSILIDLIVVRQPSEDFNKIVQSTNKYLLNNKGAAADFNILKDVSERYSEALDAEVQANISTPLYVGLLGTFSGVILGLSSLIYSGMTGEESMPPTEEVSSFITEQNIPVFLFGVLIAMTGSFCGLLLTLLGNSKLKDARSVRDALKNSYYTFLQTNLLPKLNSDMAASLGNLRAVLDSFNHDFLKQVANFRPIVESLTNNIRFQKDFIQKLDEIGFTKMANANVKVFEKIKESETLFQNFLKYQVAMNHTVEKGAELSGVVGGVLSKLTKLQEGMELVPEYLQKHDISLQKQVNFFNRHEQDLDNVAARVEQYFDKAAHRLTDLMGKKLEQHEMEAQNAYAKWQEHFSRLNEDNVYQKIVDYMQPFESLDVQQVKLNKTQEQLADNITKTNDSLLKKLEADSEIQQNLLSELKALNKNLGKPGPVQLVWSKFFGNGVNGTKVNGMHQ